MNKRVTPPSVDAEAFKIYLLAGSQLIPLHSWNSKSKDKKGRSRDNGKRPRDFNWTKKHYMPSKVVARCIQENCNIGMRLTARELVIDVDPRNGGDEGFCDLCKDYRLDPSRWPRVFTGSGGWHYYLTLPEGVRVVDTLDGYNGVEFKSVGRQVVAAGSIHPNSQPYEWDVWDNRLPLAKTPKAPVVLIEAIRRPERSGEAIGSGQFSQDQIAQMLDRLDVTEFREESKWRALMMSVHHASGGDARSEFIEWCLSDPKYSNDADIIGRRWDSLHADTSSNRITFKTLNKFLRDANAADVIPAPDAGGDFEDDIDDDALEEPPPNDPDAWLNGGPLDDDDGAVGSGAYEEKALSALEELSNTYCTVIDGDFRVMYLDEHTEMPGRRYWKSISSKSFSEHFSNRRIERDTSGMSRGAATTIPLGKAWIEWPRRPSAVGITFDATVSPAENINARIVDGRLNLWTGWGREAIDKPDGCKSILCMIRDDLCDGNEAVYSYTIKWIAYKIQNPTFPCYTSLVFRGAKGVGKTTLGGEIMAPIFGSHGLVVSRRDQFVGQFSGHLASLCFIYADEAVWGGNKEDEGVLKQLITDRHRLYRAMYKEASYGVNRVGLMMGTNEDWAAPAGFDERRFMVQDVSARHLVPQDASADHPNRIYWNELYSELRNGGLEAFLYYMRTMKLDDWAPNIGVPKTAALAAQIEQGMRGIDRWYYEMLTEADLPCLPGDDFPDWKMSRHFISYPALLQHCRAWMRDNRQAATITQRSITKKLEPFGWIKGRKSDTRGLIAPAYDDAVAAFEQRIGRKLT